MSAFNPAQFSEAKIDAATNGDNSIIAAVAAKKHRIHRLVLTVATTTTITFKDGSTALTGAVTLAAGTPLILDATESEWPLFSLSANSAFVINLGGAVQCSGRAYYTTD
jgi:hypothetical protein